MHKDLFYVKVSASFTLNKRHVYFSNGRFMFIFNTLFIAFFFDVKDRYLVPFKYASRACWLQPCDPCTSFGVGWLGLA
jgi:hypothetical protein